MSEKPRNIEITDPVTLTVDGREVTAQNGELLIDACERNDAYIPRFCYHPRMKPVGMCRMCLVEVDTGRGPALQPSCMIPVGPNMTVDTQSEQVRKAQDGVLEFLLINHPLDCPVCDKGGECPLQDQTVAYGPGESRWVEEKRHYEKPIPLSDLILMDRERCILCDRCTRFSADVAGDPLIHFIDRGASTQVNTFPDHPFASYFSGNTAQICPVGALTSTSYRFKARPWDLETVESTCTTCSVGCRISIDTSRNEVLRFNGVDSDAVNWSWLCDKGRFASTSLNVEARLGEPLMRRGESLAPVRWAEAFKAVTDAVRRALGSGGAAGIAVLGGARLTNEDAYAWAKLAKGVIGTDHVDAQMDDGLPAELVAGLPQATIDAVCAPGATVIWCGPDPKEELPVLFLRLRHAVLEDGLRLIVVGDAGSLAPLAAAVVSPRPGESADLLSSLLGDGPDEVAGADPSTVAAARALLRDVQDPLVVLGRANLAESAATSVDAAAVIRSARPAARFLPVLRRGNVRGALDAGLAPGMLPGRVSLDAGREWFTRAWGQVPTSRGLDAAGVLNEAAAGRIDVLFLVGADPVGDARDLGLAQRALAGARFVVAIDTLPNASNRLADVVLPAAAFGESAGSTTNLEGRVTPLNQAVTPVGTARSDWMIAAEIAGRLGHDLGFATLDELRQEWSAVVPMFADVVNGLPVDGQVPTPPLPAVDSSTVIDGAEQHEVSDPSEEEPSELDAVLIDDVPAPPVPVEFVAPARASVPTVNAYSLRLHLARKLYDAGVTVANTPALAPLAASTAAHISSADAHALGLASGGRVVLTSPHGSVTLSAHVDEAVARGVVKVVRGVGEVDPRVLLSIDDVVTEVRIEVAG